MTTPTALITLQEAQTHVLSHCQPLVPVEVDIDQALGCVTAVAIFADQPVPPFDNTAMDGYAVISADTVKLPTTLKVTEMLAAGHATDREVMPGEAIKIMTGAPMPKGADAIVPIEVTQPGDELDTVVLNDTARAGQYVRAAGEDLQTGQLVFPLGTELSPGHIGVLASFGVDQVPVFPKPRIGVLSTGDELVDGPGELQPGQIRDSNRHTLLALVRQYGLEAVDLGLVGDDEAAITEAIEAGVAKCDVLLTSGGVSVGDLDHVKVVLDKLGGGSMRSMQIAIKPAKPLAFGVVKGKPVFGLPGNPASAMVSFEMFVFPALRHMMGHQFPHRARVSAIADERLERAPDGKLHLMRVEAMYSGDGRFHVRSAGAQGSNLLGTMALANALALVPDGDGVDEGGSVDILLLTYR
jgi:molybdenum cofactor synthesis domain-containing protein